MKDFKSLFVTIGAMFLFSQIPSTLQSIKSFDSKLKDILVTIEKNVPQEVSYDALSFGYQYLNTSSNYCKIRFWLGDQDHEKTIACEKWLQDAVQGLNKRFGDTHPLTRVVLKDSTLYSNGNPRLSVMMEGAVIYVQYRVISRNSFEDSNLMRNELNLVRTQSKTLPRLLVLDLRGNKGGYIEQAVEVADIFLARGRVATVSYYSDMSTNRYWEASSYLSNDRWLEKIPIAIITDKKTASAAEIIVAALLDNDRAMIHIGETTFGKGVFQYSFNEDFFELKVTEGIVRRLKGGSYNQVGIRPRHSCNQPIKPASALSHACRFYQEKI